MEIPQEKLDDLNSWHGDEDLENPSVMFRTYKIRFYGLAVIGLSNIASSLNWLAVAPVPEYANSFFNQIGLSAINWFSNVFMLTYLLAGPASSWVYDHWSLRTGIIIGSVLQTLGAWLRYASAFVNDPMSKIALAMIGQIVCAVGQPFILNACTPYAALWFSADGRGTATMVGGVTNAIGMAIASLILPALVPNANSLGVGFLAIACITTGCTIPVFFIPKKPKTPPSYSASSKSKYTMSFSQSLRELFCNYNYLIIMFAFGVLCGLFSSFTSLLTQIVTPYGISVDEAGYLGAAFIVAGLVGAVITGIFIDKTGRHKWVIKAYVPIIGVMYLAFYFVVKSASYSAMMAICVLLGFFTFSLLPVALELSIESSFPISEAISSPLLWMSSQVLGLIILLVMDALRNTDGTMLRSLIFATCISIPLSILSTIYNSPNKRLEFEDRNRAASC
ncbi:major facilitator superfamily domain-containing protein [Gilbertella persicaria]|uniref:major facilitator superfamily domain-containing protein n=1 Tax=Gilbertella persicaria TaxID=101096 RepID=UPI00221E8768|nr:major facilitator superfamily domain-containing protein [Gilbertella persicaria]KAI8087980.1 major facilitator superfamily domain-containing protein [Gilbertella persicaria]